MSVTPNFSWPLIEPTDFVTNLPADLETLADDIDADVWAIKGTADAALPETIIDAAGDLIYGSAADTAARLAIGTAGQVLTVNSGATAPEWKTAASGGWTSIVSGSLSGTTIDLTSISSNYRDLRLVIKSPAAATDAQVFVRINNETSNYHGIISRNVSTASSINSSATTLFGVGLTFDLDNSSGQTDRAILVFNFYDYANTTTYKVCEIFGSVNDSSSAFTTFHGLQRQVATAAISSIQIVSGASLTGGTYELLGAN